MKLSLYREDLTQVEIGRPLETIEYIHFEPRVRNAILLARSATFYDGQRTKKIEAEKSTFIYQSKKYKIDMPFARDEHGADVKAILPDGTVLWVRRSRIDFSVIDTVFTQENLVPKGAIVAKEII